MFVCIACLRTRKGGISRFFLGSQYECNVDVKFPVISQIYISVLLIPN